MKIGLMWESIRERTSNARKFRAKCSATFLVIAFVVALAGCGGGGESIDVDPPPPPPPPPGPPPPPPPPPPDIHSEARSYLSTPRFTTHQPDVLEQIGAHYAYARGLTGRGVRIGIDDSIVDFTQRHEFGNRVKLTEADGAVLYYRRPDGDDLLSEIQTCQLFDTCRTFEGDSEGNAEIFNSWVQEIVENRGGWPIEDDTIFILDEYYDYFDSIERLYRWTEVPTPYGREGSHGTIVASTAAGTNFGVAPEATIIPVARNLTDDQGAEDIADQAIRQLIVGLPADVRENFDEENALAWREDYAKFDIINLKG